jgi:cytochrome b561
MGKPKDRRYTPTAQVLHWLMALLIVVQFVLARMAAPLPLGARKLALLAEHNLIGPGETAFGFFRALHHLLSDVLLAIASLHILAAFKHHFWNKDEVLARMLHEVRSENKK